MWGPGCSDLGVPPSVQWKPLRHTEPCCVSLKPWFLSVFPLPQPPYSRIFFLFFFFQLLFPVQNSGVSEPWVFFKGSVLRGFLVVANDRDPWYNPIHSFSHWFLKRLKRLFQALCWMGTSSLFHESLWSFQRARVVGFFFFFFFGKTVDQVFSLSPWPGHCPSLQGEMVALDPGGWPRPLPDLKLCVSLSVCLQVSWIMHLIRDSWAWKLWGVRVGSPLTSGEREVTLGLEQPFRGDSHLPPVWLRSLALVHWVHV